MSKEFSRNILEISEYLDIYMHKKTFEYYMAQIYNSILTQNSTSINNRENGISFFSFNIYLNLPFFISQKIFKGIKKKHSDYLSENEFIDYFSTIYFGTLEERAKLLFKILDFNEINKIDINDVQLFLYHLHIFKNIYRDDIDLDLINKIISSFFVNNKPFLNCKQFIEKIKSENSDLLFLLILFFFKYKPFSLEELELFDLHNNYNCIVDDNKSNYKFLDIDPIISPSNNLINYIKRYLRINNLNLIIEEGENLNDEYILNELNDFELDFQKARNNLNIPKNLNKIKKINQTISPQDILESEHDNLLGKGKTEKIESHYSSKIKCEIGLRKNAHDLEIDEITLNKVNLYICGKCLFTYNYNQGNELTIFILNKVLEIEEVGNSVLICYIIGLNPKVLEINFSNENIKNRFIKNIKHSIKFKNINEYYEINDAIGGGSFGRIFMGKEKKTGKIVAIKTIKKQYNLPIEDQNSIFWELSINKIIKHIEISYFIKIYHIFESLSTIYIVMEYAGQDLAHSLSKKWLNSDVIYDYMKQIANGILILNKFGIVHRDLKIQNIILSYENNDINDETNYKMKENIKLIDFGFSTILTCHERTNESYGTLCYISPEMINNEYYNHKIDVWTLGIIGYLLLNHKFPFFDNSFMDCTESQKFEIISKNISEKNVYLDENLFDDPKKKKLAKIVNMCLVKDIEKRANINQILSIFN